MLEQINNFIIGIGTEHLSISADSVIFPIARLLLLVLSIAAVHYLTTKLIAPALRAFVVRVSFPLMSYLLKHKFFLNLFRLIPIVLIQYFAGFIGSTTIETLIYKLTNISLIGSCAILIFCIIDSIYDVLEHKKVTRNAPIKSISQLLKVITVAVTTIMVVSTFIDKSPTYLLSGLGALSAVLLIVFKDPLVNFFAGLQITSQRLVKVGDWVEIDGVVDGNVISINMVNCTIRGWSNQTHTVSLTQLLEGKNWRDMPTIGRHIKRSFYIDVDSVEFLESSDIDRLSKFSLMKKYFEDKLSEQDFWGEEGLKESKDAIDCRQLTNVGTFRYYIKHYLTAHPKINEHATILVRQLNPTQQGLPIQIYAFAKPEHSGWVETEELASDIIDWIFAVSRRFDVTIYQQPSQLGLTKAIMGQHKSAEISSFTNSSQCITKSA
jgi:miniconductance mechanosensitive channel